MVPSVSVVIPLYNKGPHIARALNSVLAQTFQDVEVIVVDDGSTDDGAAVVRGFDDPRIRLIQQENQGVSAARNRGIEAARAELVAFLDADDEWMAGHLEVLLRLQGRYPEAGAYGTAYLVKEKGSKARVASFSDDVPREPWEGLLPSYFKAAALGAQPISASTVAIPRGILKEMGGFHTTAWYGEDTDLWGRIALKYPIAFSWHGEGIVHREASNRACNRVEPVQENIFVDAAQKAIQSGELLPEMAVDLQAYIVRKQVELAYRNLLAGQPDLARHNLIGHNCDYKFLKKWRLIMLFCTYLPSELFNQLVYLKDSLKRQINS